METSTYNQETFLNELSFPKIKKGLLKATNLAMLIGFATLILGIFAIAYPGESGTFIVQTLGVLMILAGCLRFVFAIWSFSFGSMLWRYTLATLLTLAGYWLFSHPEINLNALTIVLGVYFVLDGVNQIQYYQSIKRYGSGPTFLISGLASIALAILIFMKWPESSQYALGIYVGIKLVLDGFSLGVSGYLSKKFVKLLND